MRIALLGHGYLGKWHAQKIKLHENVTFAAIVEPFEKAHAEIQQLYPNVKVVTELKSVIGEIDAAIVVTPTSTHLSQVKFLLENQKHVYCEKPLAHDYASSQLLYELSLKHPNLVTQVGHSERCHQIFESEKKNLLSVMENGYCLFERYGAFKGRAIDVSCVEDIMVHDLDLMMYLFKPKLISCSAYGIKSKTKNWDSVHATFRSANQSFNFFASRDAIEERRQLACYGTSGTMLIDFMHNKMTTTTSELKVSSYEKRDHLLFQQQAFVASIKNKTPPLVSFKDGVQACYLVEKVLQALDENKTVELNR